MKENNNFSESIEENQYIKLTKALETKYANPEDTKSISKEELAQLSSYQIKNFSDNPLSSEELKEERKKNIEDVRLGLYNKKKNTLKQINKDITELQETIREKINTKLNMNTDQSIREKMSAKFEQLGIPAPISHIPNPRLEFFEKAGIPIPKEKSFYTEQNYGIKNPQMLDKLKSIKNGDQKKLFKQILEEKPAKNFDFLEVQPKFKLVPNPTKYDAEGKIPKTKYPTLESFDSTSVSFINDVAAIFDDTNVRDNSPYQQLNIPSRSELYSHLDQISHKPGMISRPISIKSSDFDTTATLTEAKRAELFKYYGTYYEKKYDAIAKKRQEELQQEEIVVINNDPQSKIEQFKTVCIEKYNNIVSWLSNTKTNILNYINSIPQKWADWKLRMILSKEQRDLLAALPEALAPKHVEESENIPDQFKKITQKRNTFDYFRMRDLNQRVQQIPE